MSGPLISVDELASALPDVTVLDVRWEVGRAAKATEYYEGHIPGAVFVDLDALLAGPPGPGGRHPLPSAVVFTAAMRGRGVSNHRAVVVYDDAPSTAAARAWWLLRYFGHQQVSVLDGGLAAWVSAGRPLQGPGVSLVEVGDFSACPGGMALLDASGAAAVASSGVLLDARASERFRGESEPIDPVAGHIPGARSRPAAENLEPSGRFRDAQALREEFERLGVREGVEVGAYCGSGVVAAQEVLALELAGFRAALYIGSWSNWITDSARPVARGD